MSIKNQSTPNYFWTILTMKCPRCRRGEMFQDNNPFKNIRLSHIFNMPEKCNVCQQKFELENGFWFGTGYVSYALSVALLVSMFVAWWVLIGFSTNDNRIFWCLALSILALVLLQPWIMRLSRVIYIRFFVKYDEHFEETKPTEFD